MRKHTEKQIAAIVLATLERNITIAKEQCVTFTTMQSNRDAVTLLDLAEIHKAAANNIGQVIAEAIEGDVNL